jgi:regulator of PEP synthase PpsR (kinase-PPPase family)
VTCFYLAYRGVRTANVPLVPGEQLPDELLRLEPGKVIGLTMNAHRLRSLREARAAPFRARRQVLGEYTDLRAVSNELNFAREAMERHGWRQIDVSYKSVEEVADEVLRMLRNDNVVAVEG